MPVLGVITCEILELEIAHLFGFRTELLQGSLDMLSNTWQSAKKYLQGEKELE